MSNRTLIGLMLAVLMFGASLARADAGVEAEAGKTLEDRWYVILIDAKPAGWMRQWRVAKDRRINSGEQGQVTIRRDGTAVEVAYESHFLETEDGKPIEMSLRDKQGGQESLTTTRFTDAGLEVTSVQDGREVKTTLPPIQGQWYPPAAFNRAMMKEIDGGAKTYTGRMLDPQFGAEPLNCSGNRLADTTAEVFGKTVPAQQWMVMTTPPGIPTTILVNDRQDLLRMTVEVMGVNLEIVAADEALAKAQIDPPELLAKTLVEPTGRMDKPREARSQVYQLHLQGEGEKIGGNAAGNEPAKIALPRAGAQRVVWVAERTATVVVDLDTPVAAGTDLPGDAERKASGAINSDDPKVRELVTTVLKDVAAKASPADRAEVLRRFVYRFINKKDLSVGLATASEVARTAQGDCTEHAMLLAATLRADGIPARTVTGLIYVESWMKKENVMAYHMWTQAWLDPDGRGARWIDLDATQPAPFDAGHIALATSDQSDAGGAFLEVVGLMSRLKIEIVSDEAKKAK